MTGQRRERTLAEWTMFGLAVTVLAGVIVVILGVWIAGDVNPATFVVETQTVEHRQGVYYLPAEVRNVGDETAAAVTVTAELERDGQKVAEAEQVLDFVSGGERAEVTFAFTEDPRTGRLTVAVSSYRSP